MPRPPRSRRPTLRVGRRHPRRLPQPRATVEVAHSADEGPLGRLVDAARDAPDTEHSQAVRPGGHHPGLDITAFGANMRKLPPDYSTRSHDESGQQELFVALRGPGSVDIAGERLPLDAEHLVKVESGTARARTSLAKPSHRLGNSSMDFAQYPDMMALTLPPTRPRVARHHGHRPVVLVDRAELIGPQRPPGRPWPGAARGAPPRRQRRARRGPELRARRHLGGRRCRLRSRMTRQERRAGQGRIPQLPGADARPAASRRWYPVRRARARTG
jgi:uncharacterized cupin superfamily protein